MTKMKMIAVGLAACVVMAMSAQAQMAKLSDSAPMGSEATKTAPVQRTIPNLIPDGIKPPSLSLSPAVVTTKGSFGQSITQTLVLTNGTARAMAFDMVAQDA